MSIQENEKSRGSVVILVPILLVLILFWSTFEWVVTVWQQSPLDRQGPVFVFLAAVLLLSRKYGAGRVSLARYVIPICYVLAVAMHLLSLLFDIWMISALAMMLVALPMAVMFFGSWLSGWMLVLLLVLSLPTVSFLMGGLLQNTMPGGYALGECVKWPLAIFVLALFYDREGWKRYLPLILLSPGLAGLSLAAVDNMGRESFGWLGASPLASLVTACLAIGIWYVGVVWQKKN